MLSFLFESDLEVPAEEDDSPEDDDRSDDEADSRFIDVPEGRENESDSVDPRAVEAAEELVAKRLSSEKFVSSERHP